MEDLQNNNQTDTNKTISAENDTFENPEQQLINAIQKSIGCAGGCGHNCFNCIKTNPGVKK